MKSDNVTDKTKKRVKIEFANPVGCALSDEGGLLSSECFHKRFPPLHEVCLKCLTEHAHRPIFLDEYGRNIRVREYVNGEWKNSEEREFKKFPSPFFFS